MFWCVCNIALLYDVSPFYFIVLDFTLCHSTLLHFSFTTKLDMDGEEQGNRESSDEGRASHRSSNGAFYIPFVFLLFLQLLYHFSITSLSLSLSPPLFYLYHLFFLCLYLTIFYFRIISYTTQLAILTFPVLVHSLLPYLFLSCFDSYLSRSVMLISFTTFFLS